MRETPIVFACGTESLVGLVHETDGHDLGVVIVVGGPQYRVGSHRQFVLLARHLAGHGYPVLRFDCRGMGDSSGDFPGFEHLDADIRAAVNAFCGLMPGVRRVVLWGLCDAASAALMYAPGDPRVAGLVLLNPWVRTEPTLARTQLRHYYGARLLQREFWYKLLSGRLQSGSALREFAAKCRASLGAQESAGKSGSGSRNAAKSASASFLERMAAGLRTFGKPILIVLSGGDLTAAEFEGIARSAWRALLQGPRISWHRIPAANHTFASRSWRDEVAGRTLHWLASLDAVSPSAATTLEQAS